VSTNRRIGTAKTGLVGTLFQLQVCRAVLGAGEAFNWPVAVGIIHRIVPREARSLATGLFNSGMTLGGGGHSGLGDQFGRPAR
jgi:MFS family permease